MRQHLSLQKAGKPRLIEKYVPCHRWAFRKMISDTEYSVRGEGNEAIPLALRELERYIDTDNPISTLEIGFLQQGRKLLSEMKKDGVTSIGKGRGSKYIFVQ